MIGIRAGEKNNYQIRFAAKQHADEQNIPVGGYKLDMLFKRWMPVDDPSAHGLPFSKLMMSTSKETLTGPAAATSITFQSTPRRGPGSGAP